MSMTALSSNTKAVLLLGGAALLLAATPAGAQEASTPRAETTLGEVIVTAQKRAERLIDTPQSVTALSESDLSKLGAKAFVDFASTVPGLQFTSLGAGQSQISLRGVTSGADVSPTVGIYVDETPYGSSSAFTNAPRKALDVGLFDLERVEVLRGPQGTLYGASAMGGVLKYVTRAPSLSGFGGRASVGVAGTHAGAESYDGSAVVNAPLVEGVAALRASGFYSRDGGFVDNVRTGEKNVDQSKVYGGRAEVLIAPTDALSVRLTGFAQNIRRDGGRYASVTLAGAPVSGWLEQDHPVDEPFRSDFRLVSATATYDLDAVSLTSVTSYQTAETFTTTDGSAVYAPLLQLFFGIPATAVDVDEFSRTRKFTQEVRLASAAGGRFEWLVGGYYTHEQSVMRQVANTYGAGLAVLPVNAVDARIPSTYEEYAAFGNLTFHITEKFDITGGIRFAHNEQDFVQQATGLLVASAPKAKSDESVVTYLANARYRFNPHVTAYARFATGYRPGGPNYRVLDPVTGLPAAPATFDSDSLASYEVGVKAETPDRRFAIDASGYYIDWKDIQLLTAISGVTTYLNAGGAHIKGAEVTLTARPTPSFIATGAFSYNDGYVTEANPGLGAAKGERLPNVAHWTAAVNVDYGSADHRLRPTIGATLRYVSARTASFDANAGIPQYHLPDYASVDLRAGVSLGEVEAQVYVRNLFDRRGQLSAQTVLSSFGGPAQVGLLQPRTIGMRLTTAF